MRGPGGRAWGSSPWIRWYLRSVLDGQTRRAGRSPLHYAALEGRIADVSAHLLDGQHTGRPLARCPPVGGSFSSDPRSGPRGLVSQHEALQRLRRGGGRVPVVDGLVAGGSDHEGLPAHPGHELRPPGLRPSRPGEVSEFADLVYFHVGPRLAVLTPPRM